MKTILILMVLGHGTDVATSLDAFHHGARELNPYVISQKPVPFVAQAAVFTVVEVMLLQKIAKKHPKLAKTLAYVQLGGSTAASVNNIIVSRRLRQIEYGKR